MNIGFNAVVVGGYKQRGMKRVRYYLNLYLGNGYKVYVFHRKPVPLFFLDVKIQFRDEEKLKEYIRAQRRQPTVEPF